MSVETKLTDAIAELEKFSNVDQKIAFCGLTLQKDNETTIFKSIEEMENTLRNIEIENLYNINVKTSYFMFKSVTIRLEYLTEAELNKPFKLVKIARNVNAFDSNYRYSDDSSVYSFWNKLYTRLKEMIDLLTKDEINILKTLTTSEKQNYFSIN